MAVFPINTYQFPYPSSPRTASDCFPNDPSVLFTDLPCRPMETINYRSKKCILVFAWRVFTAFMSLGIPAKHLGCFCLEEPADNGGGGCSGQKLLLFTHGLSTPSEGPTSQKAEREGRNRCKKFPLFGSLASSLTGVLF